MAASSRLYAPPAHAALVVKEGPVEPSTFTRFADAVDAISRGTTVGRMRRMFLDSASLSWISTCVRTSPAPDPTTTAKSRRSRRAWAIARRVAASASRDCRPMKRPCALVTPTSSSVSSPWYMPAI